MTMTRSSPRLREKLASAAAAASPSTSTTSASLASTVTASSAQRCPSSPPSTPSKRRRSSPPPPSASPQQRRSSRVSAQCSASGGATDSGSARTLRSSSPLAATPVKRRLLPPSSSAVSQTAVAAAAAAADTATAACERDVATAALPPTRTGAASSLVVSCALRVRKRRLVAGSGNEQLRMDHFMAAVESVCLTDAALLDSWQKELQHVGAPLHYAAKVSKRHIRASSHRAPLSTHCVLCCADVLTCCCMLRHACPVNSACQCALLPRVYCPRARCSESVRSAATHSQRVDTRLVLLYTLNSPRCLNTAGSQSSSTQLSTAPEPSHSHCAHPSTESCPQQQPC